MQIPENVKFYQQQEAIQKHIREILILLGDNPNRPGLKETPQRVSRMMAEVFEGMRYTNAEIAEMFDKCFEDCSSSDLVTIGNIPIFSYCEHHMALMYDMHVSVGYIPNGKVIGLSKVARVADMVSKRLQLQERIGRDIFEVLSIILDTEDIIVTVTGKHSCMTARGIKKPESVTKTAVVEGKFMSKPELRQEFYLLTKEN